MLKEARYFARMMRGCQRFLSTPPLADPRAAIAYNLEHRESNFLALMRDVVFANAANPYHKLFVLAGCDFGDLKERVGRQGLEGTLRELRTAGVYLSHNEFKGKEPIVRHGREIGMAGPEAFANPRVRGALETTSSGSRSRGTVTRPSAEFQAYREAQDALFVGQFHPESRAIVAVLPILPSTVGFNRMLTFERRGTPVEKWFALGGTLRDSAHYRLLIRLLVLQARSNGLRIPFPTYIHESNFNPVVDWMAEQQIHGHPLLWMGPVSMGVLVAAAAIERGVPLKDTVFLCGAEPLTEARRHVMEAAGGTVYPRYGISELGWVGCSCHEMRQGSTVHLMRDAIAAITWRRPAPMTDVEVDSLLFTTILPISTYVLVNVEMEDCGVLEDATCGCELAAMGFSQQIRDVFSFGKLTGQGITLLGGDLIRVLEVSLPQRFGGTPADYQLVELDGGDGAIVELRVHPRIALASPEAVREGFLAEVRRLWGGSLTARQWGQTGAVRVVSKEPIISGGRKINSLHLLGPSQPGRR
jgi:hypothetical protein